MNANLLKQHIDVLTDEDELDGAITGFRAEFYTVLIDNPSEISDEHNCRIYMHSWIPGVPDPEYNLVGCFDVSELESLIPLLIVSCDKINELVETMDGGAS